MCLVMAVSCAQLAQLHITLNTQGIVQWSITLSTPGIVQRSTCQGLMYLVDAHGQGFEAGVVSQERHQCYVERKTLIDRARTLLQGLSLSSAAWVYARARVRVCVCVVPFVACQERGVCLI